MKKYFKPVLVVSSAVNGIIPLAALGAAASAAAGFAAANASSLGAAAGAAYVMAGDDKRLSFDRSLILQND